MIKWIKQSGVEIETNEEPKSIAMAESLGWKQAPKKRGRKPKAEVEADGGNS
jgi:hypothetical protein